jgi:hypothetical protein
MSFDLNLSADVERELERYAQAEHVTPAQAAEKFIQSGLKASKRKTAPKGLSEADWELLRQDPTVAFFERLPEPVFEQMEAASKQIHAERFKPRG